MQLIDDLAEEIRLKEKTPDEALAALQNNEVLVWPADEPEENPTWGGVEDRAASYSGLSHALNAVGASGRYNEFAAEVNRLREAGQTIP